MNPLDKVLPVETLDGVRDRLELAERRLAEKYSISREGFSRELSEKLMSGRIEEDADVIAWQSAYVAWLDWNEDNHRRG